MKIDTIYHIDDEVYFIGEDKIQLGKIVQIVVSIDSHNSKVIKFTIMTNCHGHEEYCDKYNYEVDYNIDNLLVRLKNNISGGK